MKRVLIALTVVMFLAVNAVASDYESVKNLSREKNYAEVIKQAPALIATLSGQRKVALQIYYASAFAGLKDYDKAIEEYEKALLLTNVEAEKIHVKLIIGDVLQKAGKVDEALAKWESLTTIKDNHQRILAKRRIAVTLLGHNRYDEAIIAFNNVIADLDSKAKDKTFSYIWIARTYYIAKDKDASIEAFKQVILVTKEPRSLAEAIKAKDLVGEKELADTLEERKNTEIFDDLITLLCGKMFNEKGELITKLGTYDTVYVLAKMEKVMDESIYPAELSLVWAKITRLTGIEGVDRFAVEKWLEANK